MEHYLREMCFILEEETEGEGKIYFSDCMSEYLQKQLINYSHNEPRERAQIPPLTNGHMVGDLILSLFVLAGINFLPCGNHTH